MTSTVYRHSSQVQLVLTYNIRHHYTLHQNNSDSITFECVIMQELLDSFYPTNENKFVRKLDTTSYSHEFFCSEQKADFFFFTLHVPLRVHTRDIITFPYLYTIDCNHRKYSVRQPSIIVSLPEVR